MPPVVSIITISYNAETEIEKTIQSVLCQTCTDYEFIFIDGCSKDQTVSIIESYRSRFEALGITYRVTSEPDHGIYDAMNKGIRQACGKWVHMLNAGDCLADPQVLADVFSHPELDRKIIYGDTILKETRRNTAYYKYQKANPLSQLSSSMPFCHQSVFVPRDLMCRHGFDAKLRIAADYKFFSQAYTNGSAFLHIPRAISIYDCSGISNANTEKVQEEYNAIQAEFYPTAGQPHTPSPSQFSSRVKDFVKMVFPDLVYSPARGWHKDPHFYQSKNAN